MGSGLGRLREANSGWMSGMPVGLKDFLKSSAVGNHRSVGGVEKGTK